ncbi:hypothetical protein D3C87_1993070 [compost metagenome]
MVQKAFEEQSVYEDHSDLLHYSCGYDHYILLPDVPSDVAIRCAKTAGNPETDCGERE